MDAAGRSYAAVGGSQGLVRITTMSVLGTNSADVAIVNTQFVVPFKCVVRSLAAFIKTGGTAAGPSPLLQYSTAGTGTWTTIGTLTLGTNADNTVVTGGVTATELAAGDAIRMAGPDGTVASTPILHVTIGFTEAFTGA